MNKPAETSSVPEAIAKGEAGRSDSLRRSEARYRALVEATTRDVTDRKEAEVALREADRK